MATSSSLGILPLVRSCVYQRHSLGGAENAGVENAGAITHGKPSEQKTLKTPQECRLKRSSLKQFLNNAHEQRPGVHIQTSLLTIIVKDSIHRV